jgi:hypothetical protein
MRIDVLKCLFFNQPSKDVKHTKNILENIEKLNVISVLNILRLSDVPFVEIITKF